jgi:8-oxo-dGTP diphosphatase
VLLVRTDGRIALGHRVAGAESPSWCLPGGHLEAGETPLEAGLRETREETGVSVASGTVFAVCVRTAGTGVTFGVRASVPSGQRLDVCEPHAIDDWVWADPRQPPEPLFPATRAVLHAWLSAGDALDGWAVYPVDSVGPIDPVDPVDPVGSVGEVGGGNWPEAAAG